MYVKIRIIYAFTCEYMVSYVYIYIYVSFLKLGSDGEGHVDTFYLSDEAKEIQLYIVETKINKKVDASSPHQPGLLKRRILHLEAGGLVGARLQHGKLQTLLALFDSCMVT